MDELTRLQLRVATASDDNLYSVLVEVCLMLLIHCYRHFPHH